ncbi:hypothetical protein BC629DRAFT_1437469 [Irpex lacteus]|nr:hypothetical protein BC629DRAFT_1437469 [Irpex lacteus]
MDVGVLSSVRISARRLIRLVSWSNKAVIEKLKNCISSENIKNHMTSTYFDVKWIYMSSGPDFHQDSESELRILIGKSVLRDIIVVTKAAYCNNNSKKSLLT